MVKNLQGEFLLSKTDAEQNKLTMDSASTKAREATTEKVEVDLKNRKKIIEIPRERSKPHFFSSYAEYPDGVTFENQNADEEILLLIRRDFITNLPWILGTILLIAAPFVLSPIIALTFPNLILSPNTQAIILGTYYTMVFGFLLAEFAIWYFNVALVTSQRLIDVDISGILFKDIAETQLELIQDVSYNQHGAVRSIFDYGDVLVQTAGTLPNFELDRAPNPSAIAHIIGNLINQEQDSEKENNS